MVAELQVQLKAEDGGPYEPQRVPDEEKRRMMQVGALTWGLGMSNTLLLCYCGISASVLFDAFAYFLFLFS